MIGDSVGRTIEIEDRIASKEIMKEGRIKVMLDRAVTLPMSLPLLVEDLRFQIQIEKDPDDRDSFPRLGHSDKGKILHDHKTRRGDQRRTDQEVEDDDNTALDLDFKLPASCATSGDELAGWHLNQPIVGHMGSPKMQAGQGAILMGDRFDESPQKELSRVFSLAERSSPLRRTKSNHGGKETSSSSTDAKSPEVPSTYPNERIR